MSDKAHFCVRLVDDLCLETFEMVDLESHMVD